MGANASHGGSILLVDDTPANLQLLIEALGELHYDVRPAINGELALESARSLCPDLVLLDINMPGMDGYEVCRRLKADPATREVPVIFISSMEETLDKVKAFNVGGVDYISKPFQAEEVLARINSHLELRRVQLELAEHKANLERLVAERTRELQDKNRALRDEIDHRREVERALNESEHRYLSLVEYGFDGIFVHQDYRISYVNQQLIEMLGYTADELLGANVMDFVAADSLDLVQEAIDKTPGSVLELGLRHKDGRTLEVESFVVDCRFHGQSARIGAIRDISARKQAVAKLRASERRYASLFHQFEALLDAISDPLVLLTEELQPLWTNQAYEAICSQLDCGLEEGKTLFHLDASEQGAPVDRCLESGQMVEDMVTTADGRMWGVKAFPLKDARQQTNQVIATAVDITEKVRLREEANRASRLASLGELAAGIAHEINNPNAVILLNMPIIRDAFNDAQAIFSAYSAEQGPFSLAGIDYADIQQELPSLIDRVQESAERIKRIVEDLKNFMRDGSSAEFAEVDLNLVVEAAARLLQNSIEKATHRFDIELSADLPFVKGHFQKLEQVVVNLVQNACQALTSPEQGICVATGYNKALNQVFVQVCDQGGGIDPQIMSRIRDPFFTTKRSSGGTGLGLSVSERILREHKGLMTVSSTPGEGSEFRVVLPANR